MSRGDQVSVGAVSRSPATHDGAAGAVGVRAPEAETALAAARTAQRNWARTPAAERAQETDRASLAAMFAFAALCLLAGVLPGLFIDALAPVVQGLAGARMPQQSTLAWLSIVPVAESRSSYNGLLVFVFITVSTLLTIEVIHRFASRAVRRGPAWDCGFRDASPATQYSADSFVQPIRRVFGTVVFQARERVDMPPPGDVRPARLAVMLVHQLCALPVATRHVPRARPAFAMHGMAHTGPVLFELEFLAIENETAICNAIGERHQRIAGGFVAAAGRHRLCRHRPQEIGVAVTEARDRSAGLRRKLDREAAGPKGQRGHGVASNTIRACNPPWRTFCCISLHPPMVR